MQFTDRHPRGRPCYVSVAVAAQRSILFRLDKAFNAFFERVRRAEKPGFPRFRSRRCAVRSFETERLRIHCQGAWQSVTAKGAGRPGDRTRRGAVTVRLRR